MAFANKADKWKQDLEDFAKKMFWKMCTVAFAQSNISVLVLFIHYQNNVGPESVTQLSNDVHLFS